MQVSIVNYLEIQNSRYGERLDAEFYLPIYLTLDLNIEKNDYCDLSDITSKIDVGHVGSMVNEYSKKGIWLIQTKNVRSFFLDSSTQIYINSAFHKRLQKSQIENEDILIARSGSFGTASIYLSNDIVNSSDIIVIKAQRAIISPYYLVTFLNCRYGSTQLIRFSSGGLQGHVNLTILEKLKVTRFSVSFETQIESIVLRSYHLIEQSKTKYQQAQTLLLEELGLAEWQPKHQLTFIKNYSDTKQAHRIDAEYFQPKYEEIINAIKSYSGGWCALNKLVSITKGVEVGRDAYQDIGVPFVRVSDIMPFEILKAKHITNEVYTHLQQYQLQKGDILLTKDATPSISHYLSCAPPKMVFSSGVLRLALETDKFMPECLSLVLNSLLVSKQAERDCSGSVILHWTPAQVGKAKIPILNTKIQQQIEEKISSSMVLRKQSKHLLESAKRAVEIAIEQDENAAIEWLEG